jgi:hypothetical protein
MRAICLYVQRAQLRYSTMVIFPEILQDAAQKNISWNKDISIAMASIGFTPKATNCTSNCTYTANVVWTNGSPARTCGNPLNPVADSAPPTNTTLPTDAFGPGSLIVVDVAYNYIPMLGLGIVTAIPIKQTAYLAPRYVPLIEYSVATGDDGIGTECPGY